MASFRPDSRFGVPLNPFPPGFGWESTLKMVEDVLEDLKLSWVQDFILRSHLRQDVNALSDSHNYSRATSNIAKTNFIPGLKGGTMADLSYVRLDIPVISIDNIGVGVGVEKVNINGNSTLCFQSNQFFRSVSNNRKNSSLVLRIQDELGTIGCQYMVYDNVKKGLWKFCHLTWENKSFLDAFDKTSSNVDFHLLHQGLKESTVGGVQHPRKPTIPANHLYPNEVADCTGDHFLSVVFCTYSNAQPLKSIPVFIHARYSHDYDASELRKIQRWGITERMNRINFSPLQERLIPDNILVDDNTRQRLEENNNIRPNKMSITNFLLNKEVDHGANMASPVDHLIPVQIEDTPVLPSQVHVRPSASTRARFVPIWPHPRPLTEPQVEEEGLDARKELRKIRKRESAARSYRRNAGKRKKK